MAYQQFPYLQAHPPPGYGAPGSTAYYTTQHLGGFYAPISNNPPFPQVHGAAPMIGNAGMPPGMPTGPIGNIGSGGQMFNGWPGSAEEQKKQREECEEREEREEREEQAKAEAEAKSERSENKKKKKHKKKKNRPSTPWEQVVADIDKEDEGHRESGSHEDGGSYDHCDCSGSDGSACSATEGEGIENDDDDDDGDIEVVIQQGGSAQVVMYLNHRNQDRPPKRTCFIVSARRMRAEARGWLHMCHRGTDRYDTTVSDEAAVVGMYWLLQVLHTGVEGDHAGSEYDYDHRNENGLRPGMAPATTPRAPMTIPTELPVRVLAYTTLFAHQLGVLDKSPQALPGAFPGSGNNGNNSDDGEVGPPYNVNTPVDRFHARADVWLRAITRHPRHRNTFDSTAIVPADWPFVLYTARVLSDRMLFATCLRTMLDRWYVDERGLFCDVHGPARLDQLPASMRETVLRDMGSLRTARERSVDAIINGAMNAFHYGSNGRH
ncbi:hypothetical protein SBRCBS47491_006379 [Sporothrix bragantina]|uniref:Uncharacterized protein n=1 Tax=Sporothrix bragantina TaxID=671064 RepID=A0ABP0C4E8_9PEZI